jgi:drug/metabolite transporter (DMT)-like permease
MQNHSLLFGILCGIATGAFWGIPFLAPQILSDYAAIYLTLGRFGFFGLVSLLFLPQVIRYLKALGRRDLWQVFLLSLSGFSIYSFLLFWSVPKAGGVAAALIIGLLPITISLFGFKEKSLTKSFYVGIFCIFAGLLLLTLPSLHVASSSATTTLWGYLGCVVCLALWTWFANQNSRFLRKHPDTNPKVFSAVMGILSLLVVIPLVFVLADQPLTFLASRPDLKIYVFWSLLLGLGASWAANWLWNICSKACPPQISGPLIVSETFFGLLYTFIYEVRFPTTTETLSIVLSISGVLICIRSQMKKPKLAK